MKSSKILLICFAYGFLACSHFSPPVQPEEGKFPRQALQRTHIVLLGTGTPNTDPQRYGPSLAVVAGGIPYIVDCGTGVVRRAAAAYQGGVTALKPKNLQTAFITHLHSDHTIGYADLIFSPWEMGRSVPLKVFGPPGTAAMTRHLLEAYQEDIGVRLHGLEPALPEGYKVKVVEGQPGIVYEDQNIKVRAFTVNHGAWKHAFGYYITAPDIRICISGDTAPYPEMADNYRGCDILIHEVYCQKGFEARSREWQAYHAASHTSAVELGKIAARVQPKLLVLIHQLLWSGKKKDVLAEIRRHFSGPVLYGRDLTFIGLPPGLDTERLKGSDFTTFSIQR